LFRRKRLAASAGLFLDGLLGNEPRKKGSMRVEAAGDPGPGASRRSWAAASGTRMSCAQLTPAVAETQADLPCAREVVDDRPFFSETGSAAERLLCRESGRWACRLTAMMRSATIGTASNNTVEMGNRRRLLLHRQGSCARPFVLSQRPDGAPRATGTRLLVYDSRSNPLIVSDPKSIGLQSTH
jgi:hypothetical protein